MIPDLLLLFYSENVSTVSVLTIARAGRAARASGRIARILRVSRFYSCFGYNQKEIEEEQRKQEKEKGKADEKYTMELEPSKMGNRMINSTTNKVIFDILQSNNRNSLYSSTGGGNSSRAALCYCAYANRHRCNIFCARRDD